MCVIWLCATCPPQNIQRTCFARGFPRISPKSGVLKSTCEGTRGETQSEAPSHRWIQDPTWGVPESRRGENKGLWISCQKTSNSKEKTHQKSKTIKLKIGWKLHSENTRQFLCRNADKSRNNMARKFCDFGEMIKAGGIWRGGGLGSSTIFKKFNEPYAPS